MLMYVGVSNSLHTILVLIEEGRDNIVLIVEWTSAT
jgi:hypothetical protein